MIRTDESWFKENRFFLPNEDARLTEAILHDIPSPSAVAFVGGSGMLLLEVLPSLSPKTDVSFVDVSPWQADYFQRLRDAILLCNSAYELRKWFSDTVYPELSAFYARRKMNFPLKNVFDALKELFGISFFHDDSTFRAIKRESNRVRVHVSDMVTWLCGQEHACDFVHLSNICDYLPPTRFPKLFSSFMNRRAYVQLLTTDICKCINQLEDAWAKAGFSIHDMSPGLDQLNHALGASNLQRSWNRHGHVMLLTRETAACEANNTLNKE